MKQNTRKTIIHKVLLLLLCVLMVGMQACSTAPASSEESTAPSESEAVSASESSEPSSTEEEITLRVSWWGSDTRTSKTIEFLELYASENPGIHFEYEYPEDYTTKLLTQAMSNDMPDIPQTDYTVLSSWGKEGYVIDLQTYVDNGTIDFSNVEESYYSPGVTDGKLYGVSNGVTAFVMLYNKRIAEECGITFKPGYTWDDLYAWSQKVYDQTGAKAQTLAHAGDGNILIIQHAREMGYYTYNEDGTAFGFPVDIVKDVFEMQYKFLTSGFGVDADLAVEKGIYEESLITTGEQWYQTTWSSMYGSIQSVSEDELGIAVMPRSADATDWPNYTKPTNFMSISKDSQYADACAKVINYIANSTEVHKILNLDRGVPISTVVRNEITSDPEILPETARLMEFFSTYDQYAVPVDPPYPDAHGNIVGDDVFGAYQQAFLFGQMTPEEAAENFYNDASALLAE